ncbi:MAG: PQQ-dependent sugar dehydrogenase [Pyrinomonadaceae bacterium]
MKKFIIFTVLLVSVALSITDLSAQGVPAPLTIRLQSYLTGLSLPVLVTSSKDGTGRLFVVQQRGLIRVVQPGSTTPADFINLTSKVSSSGNERGLLGLTFHPDFETNSYFFVNYTRLSDGATIVARYKAINSNTQGDINTEVILLTIPQPFSNHNGGMIDFRTDNGVHNLYIGMGDGGSANDPGSRSQNINDLLGKMLRITPSTADPAPNPAYTNPPDNPYVGIAGADEIYAIGLRNPWRWSFDRGGTNQLWAGDVGQNAIEEISDITRGANYGWRVYEGNNCTNLDPNSCAGGTNPITHTPPVYQYSHSGGRCSVTGGYVYRGARNTFPLGTYVYADYCTGEIFVNGSNTSALLVTPRNITSFGEDDEGELYVVGQGGTVERIVRAKSSADFDGDLRTDVSVFRPSNGVWYILNSSNNSVRSLQWGLSGDVPVPEDYDGDNITDVAVYRPSNNVWYYIRSSDSTVGVVQFGSSGDIPTHGDYDGDARADLAIYRPSTGFWWIRRSSSPSNFLAVPFGISTDVPTAADYDGDGKYDVAVYRPSDGTWHRLSSINGGYSVVGFGLNGDVATPGDFDGDGRADQAVYRPSTGIWYLQRSTSGFAAFQWGVNTDVPVVGDYDADGRDDIAVFRPSNGVWYLSRSTGGNAFIQWGLTGDLASPSFDTP